MNNLIGEDIKLMRDRYDEALKLRGVKCQYQFPIFPDSNQQAESVIDSYSPVEDTFIFFEGSPKVKTFKRFGWVVENDQELPFLIHCSFNLHNVQRDCIFRISGQYTELPERVFKVTEISYDIQAPDHIVCQVIPVYEKQIVGRTPVEVKQTFNKSNHFLKSNVDYRGNAMNDTDRYRIQKPDKLTPSCKLIGTVQNSNMLKVNASDIFITRGDSAYFNVDIKNPNGTKYIREDGDSLIFTVKESVNSKQSLIKKSVEGLCVTIEPTDTESLKYGTYMYDVQLTTVDGKVFTVIGPAKFSVTEEVTF